MRAVWMTEFGGPEVLVAGEAPDPVPGPGQALVKVEIVNVTFVETQFRASGFGPFKVEPPIIPGNGVGGTIVAVGEGADSALVGTQVVTSTGGSGGYAELAAVDAGGVLPVPDGVDLADAVALLADGRTATMLVRAADVRPGERVLVEAAAGGVGTVLVQLTRAAGATVVAAAGGEHKLALARELGAAVTADYRQADWAEAVREAVGGLDVVFDGVGGDIARAAFDLLDPGGRMLSFGLASGTWADVPAEIAAARDVSVRRAPFAAPKDMPRFARSALAEAAAGRLRAVIGQRFPLERAADAHAAVESRSTVGKTLLVV